MTTLADSLLKPTFNEIAEDANIVGKVCSLVASAMPGMPEPDKQFALMAHAALYQDDDAHETCSLTACLNPLHPGPCKGWKGTLFKAAPNAYHALEAARVEKANAARIKKIQALKEAGKPIPKKLLQPIVAKPHPHAGKTANAATGEAHAAGQAVSDSAGVHVQMPGKVTLGQAVKQIKATDATNEKGAKGKKPTVASKGIAAVIAQEKVTPQYKLDKAAKITPEQWNALSEDEKSIIRGELTKIQTEGFGPQQKKATELLDALPAKGLKGGGTDTVTTPKGQVIQKISLKDINEGPAPQAPSPVNPPKTETPAKAKINTFTVTHNGVTYTRKSKHEYTHAAVIQKPDGTQEVWSFHKSEDAALKNGGGLTAEAKKNGFKVVAALPVTKVEPGKKAPEKPAPEVKAPNLPETPNEPSSPKSGATSAAQAAAIATISDAIPGIKSMPEGASEKLVAAFDKLKTKGDLADTPQFKTAVNALAQKALKVATEDKMPGLGHGDNDAHIGTFHKEISDHILEGKPGLPPLVAKMAAHHEATAPKNVKEGIEQAAKAAHEAKIENAAQAAEKAAALPKHVQHAAAIANHEVPGAGLSKNHLAAYEKLTAEEFNSLPEATQGKIIQELEKGQTKFLDPKKIAASKALIEKFQAGKPKAAAPKPPAEVGFHSHMDDHAVTDAQAKKAAAGQPVAAHAAVAKNLAKLDLSEQPDVMAHQNAAKQYGKDLLTSFTKDEPLDALKDPEVQQAAQNVLDAATTFKEAQLVGKAKKTAFNKIDMLLKGDSGQLTPMQKASLAEYQKYLLKDPIEPEQLVKLQNDILAATDDLREKLKAAKTPKPDEMTPAQLDAKVAELLGPAAVKPNVNLTMAELKEANATGANMAKIGTEKYSEATLENPEVAAKMKAVAQIAGQLAATAENKKKLQAHLDKFHNYAIESHEAGVGYLNAPQLAAIKAHAEKIKKEHAYLDEVTKQQQDKLIAARKEFDKVADEVQAAGVPKVELTDADQTLISEAFGHNWGNLASKAVLYGVKGWSQKSEMKSHPDYASFTQDLGNLQTAVKKLALAHAAEHVASLNVPVDPDTGAKIDGPEKKAWLAAVTARAEAEKTYQQLYKTAQTKLDKIRTDVGLKKRALPKIDSPAVKAAAAESGYYKTAGYGGINYGKHAKAKNYILAKVGPKLGIVHQSASEKKAEKAAAEAEKLKAAHPEFYAKQEAAKAAPKPNAGMPSTSDAGKTPNPTAAEKYGWTYVPNTGPQLHSWEFSTGGAYIANPDHLKQAQDILADPDVQTGLAAQKKYKWSINNMESKGASHSWKQSLYNYTGSGYDSVNTKLNSLPPGAKKTGSPTISNIDAGMAASPEVDQHVVLYRGFKDPKSVFSSGKWNDTNVAGMEWTQRSYSSTSGQLSTAQSFAGYGGVVMRIIIPKDQKVHGINAKGGQHPGENEIILQRGLRYRVVADYGKHGSDGKRYIDVMVVPDPYAKPE
jgi:hypothetical protein